MIPRIVILPLMYVCDARCAMCNIWKVDGPRGWQPDQLREVLSHPTLVQHVEVVNVTGGEPTMRPDLPEVVDAIIDSLPGLHTISLQTNGLSAARLEKRLEPIIKRLVSEHEAGRTIHLDINISCDGPGAVHDRVRGVPGAWRSLTESVAVAQRLVLGLPSGDVTLNLTIVRTNVPHLREAELAAERLGVQMTFTLPQETEVYVANTDIADQFVLTPDDRVAVADFLRELQARLTGRSAMSRRYARMLVELLEGGERNLGCPLSDGGLFLEPGGRSLPCWRSEELVAGNVLTDGVDAVLAKRDDPAYIDVLKSHCLTCPSNCYVDWGRRMFARAASGPAEETR